MKISLSLLLPFALFIFSVRPELYLFIGETGVGKSASINSLAQKKIATEGHGFSSETSDASTYAIEIKGRKDHYIDVPGILDTSGLTEDEIAQFIKTEIFKQRETHGFDKISGIIIVLDASLTRIRVRDSVLAAINMFGESCLNSIVLALNKVEKLSPGERKAAFDFVSRQANAVGIAANRVEAFDAKGNLGAYYPALEERLRKLPGYSLTGMNALEQRAEAYFQEELKKEENYNNFIEQVPRIIEREVREQVMIDEAYRATCNCRYVCVGMRLFGACLDEDYVCDTCAYTRKVPRTITKKVQETVYDSVHHRKLKNEQEHYRRVAKDRVIQEIRKVIFQQQELRNRNQTMVDL